MRKGNKPSATEGDAFVSNPMYNTFKGGTTPSRRHLASTLASTLAAIRQQQNDDGDPDGGYMHFSADEDDRPDLPRTKTVSHSSPAGSTDADYSEAGEPFELKPLTFTLSSQFVDADQLMQHAKEQLEEEKYIELLRLIDLAQGGGLSSKEYVLLKRLLHIAAIVVSESAGEEMYVAPQRLADGEQVYYTVPTDATDGFYDTATLPRGKNQYEYAAGADGVVRGLDGLPRGDDGQAVYALADPGQAAGPVYELAGATGGKDASSDAVYDRADQTVSPGVLAHEVFVNGDVLYNVPGAGAASQVRPNMQRPVAPVAPPRKRYSTGSVADDGHDTAGIEAGGEALYVVLPDQSFRYCIQFVSIAGQEFLITKLLELFAQEWAAIQEAENDSLTSDAPLLGKGDGQTPGCWQAYRYRILTTVAAACVLGVYFGSSTGDDSSNPADAVHATSPGVLPVDETTTPADVVTTTALVLLNSTTEAARTLAPSLMPTAMPTALPTAAAAAVTSTVAEILNSTRSLFSSSSTTGTTVSATSTTWRSPTAQPTSRPTEAPVTYPPTRDPSFAPTAEPTGEPTANPSDVPTHSPSAGTLFTTAAPSEASTTPRLCFDPRTSSWISCR